jgi:hypothetical protein
MLDAPDLTLIVQTDDPVDDDMKRNDEYHFPTSVVTDYLLSTQQEHYDIVQLTFVCVIFHYTYKSLSFQMVLIPQHEVTF